MLNSPNFHSAYVSIHLTFIPAWGGSRQNMVFSGKFVVCLLDLETGLVFPVLLISCGLGNPFLHHRSLPTLILPRRPGMQKQCYGDVKNMDLPSSTAIEIWRSFSSSWEGEPRQRLLCSGVFFSILFLNIINKHCPSGLKGAQQFSSLLRLLGVWLLL